MSRKSDKRSEKMFWLGQKKFWKKVQKSEKTAFLTSQKKWKPSLAAMLKDDLHIDNDSSFSALISKVVLNQSSIKH